MWTERHARTWFAALAVLTTFVVAGTGAQLRWGLFVPREREIAGSWAFELDDPSKVMGYSDFVVAASVVGRGDTVKSMRTNYEIVVERSLKGELDGTWIVSQLGYSQGRDTFVPEGQPPLEVGESYVLSLVVDVDAESLNVLGGPLAVEVVSGQGAVESSVLGNPGLRSRYPDELVATKADQAQRRAAFVANHAAAE